MELDVTRTGTRTHRERDRKGKRDRSVTIRGSGRRDDVSILSLFKTSFFQRSLGRLPVENGEQRESRWLRRQHSASPSLSSPEKDRSIFFGAAFCSLSKQECRGARVFVRQGVGKIGSDTDRRTLYRERSFITHRGAKTEEIQISRRFDTFPYESASEAFFSRVTECSSS